MTLKRFLDCAFALLVENKLRIPGMDLMQATTEVKEALLGIAEERAEPQAAPPSEEAIARQNAAALQEIQTQLKGLRLA